MLCSHLVRTASIGCASVMPLPAKKSIKLRKTNDATLSLLREDSRTERNFISVLNKFDILRISFFMM